VKLNDVNLTVGLSRDSEFVLIVTDFRAEASLVRPDGTRLWSARCDVQEMPKGAGAEQALAVAQAMLDIAAERCGEELAKALQAP
jgi:hypothetical protein